MTLASAGGRAEGRAAMKYCKYKHLSHVQAALDTASFFRWSMNTCRLTSSVRIGAPDS